MPPKKSQRTKEKVQDREFAMNGMRNKRSRNVPPPIPTPTPQPSDSENEMETDQGGNVGGGNVEVGDVANPKNVRAGLYLDHGEITELTGQLLFDILENANLSKVSTFTCDWYPDIVDQFHNTFRIGKVSGDDSEVVGHYNVNNVRGCIKEEDLCRIFDMSREGYYDYLERRWSEKFPISREECAMFFNNGRTTKRADIAWKCNLTGIQKMVWKVVSGILLPTNTGASDLTMIHSFVTWAILNGKKVNLPHLMLEHISFQNNKIIPHQYGMIISHILVDNQSIPILEGQLLVSCKKESMIGKHSLVSQELYMWEGRLLSKWEVFEQYELVRDDVWKFNHCGPPIPPKGWIPTNEEPIIYPQPVFYAPIGAGRSSRSSGRTMFDMIHTLMINMFGELRVEMRGMREDIARLCVGIEHLTTQVDEMRTMMMQGYPLGPQSSFFYAAAVLEKVKGASDPTKLPSTKMCGEKTSLFSHISIKKPLSGLPTVPTVLSNMTEASGAARAMTDPKEDLFAEVLGKRVPLFTCSGMKKPFSKASVATSVSSVEKEGIKENDDSHSRSLAKGNQITKVVDVITEPEKIIYEQGDCGSKAPVSCLEPASTECPKACPITSCFSLRSDNSQSWPFTKKSSMWKVIESMEVFKKVPQMPQLFPLTEHEEKSREKMLAINMMMKYSYEVESITAGSLDDLSSIQGTLKTLKELESHGFNTNPLQAHLNKLLVKMGEEEELKGNLDEVENGIRKCQGEKTEFERKVTDLDGQIKALQQQLRAEKSVKCLKDLQLANLEAQRDIMTRKLHDFQLARKLPFEW